MYRSTTAFPTEIQYIRSSLFWVYIHMYMYCIYVAIYTYMDQNTYTLHIDFHKQTRTHTHTWLYLIMYIHTYLCTCLCIYKGMLVILTIFAPKWKCGRGTVYLRFHHRFLEHRFRCHQRTASVLADSGQRKSCMGSDSIADKLKGSWWTDFQICLHPLDHVKSTCSFSLFSPAFEPRCFVPLLKQGCPVHSTAKSDWRRFQQFPALMLLLLYISAAWVFMWVALNLQNPVVTVYHNFPH